MMAKSDGGAVRCELVMEECLAVRHCASSWVGRAHILSENLVEVSN
jgi:hypothetical protein